MASVPSPEPYRAICIKLGLLTVQQADDAQHLQKHVAEALDLAQDFLEVCEQKGLLNAEQVKLVKKEARKEGQSGESLDQSRGVKELAGYRVIEKIGEGAMGSVYKVHQKSLDRIVALKILPPKLAANKLFVDRFFREARASAALNHPNIVQGIDVGEDRGLHYFAMEFIDGETVGQRLKREGPLPLDDVLEIARETALALSHAHKRGLVHRDIKPDNLMLTAIGGRKNKFVIKVMDLGLARAMVDNDALVTHSGTAVGTPYYISPEQARGDTQLTPACDLYSLGATLFHIATGQTPFEGNSSAVVMAKHMTDPVPNPKSIRPDMPNAMAAILKKLLAKNARDRYPSAEALADDCQRILNGERPEHVKVPAARAGSTGPLNALGQSTGTQGSRPGSRQMAHGDLDPALPSGRPAVQAKPFPAVPVASAAVLVMIGLAALVNSFMDAGDKPPTQRPPKRSPLQVDQPPKGKNETATTDKTPDKLEVDPSAAKSDALELDPVIERSDPEEERWKRISALNDEALEIAREQPNDWNAQRNAWTRLLAAAGDSKFAVQANEALAQLAEKERQGTLARLQPVVDEILDTARAGDFRGADRALDLALKNNPKTEERLFLGQQNQVLDHLKAEKADALMKDAANLRKLAKLEEAAEIYQSVLALEIKEISEAVGRELTALKEENLQLEQVRRQAIIHKWTQLFLLIYPALEKMDFDLALEILKEAEVDPDMKDRPLRFQILKDAFEHGLAPVTRLLKAKQKAAVESGNELSFMGLLIQEIAETERSPLIKFKKNRYSEEIKVNELDWAHLRHLADFRAETIDQVAQWLEPRDSVRVATLLALTNAAPYSKLIHGSLKTAAESNPDLASSLATLDEMFPLLGEGLHDLSSRHYWEAMNAAYAKRNYSNASVALTEATRGRPTAFILEQVPTLSKSAFEINKAAVDQIEKQMPLENLFRGKCKATGGFVQLDYDFEDSGQLNDFMGKKVGWNIKEGNLILTPEEKSAPLWHKTRFAGNGLSVIFSAKTKSTLSCLLGAEISHNDPAWYAFEFGETCRITTRRSKAITSNGLQIATDAPNRITITRTGPAVEGWLENNNPENARQNNKLLKFNDAMQIPSRHLALGNAAMASFDHLSIQGTLDREWEREQRNELARRALPTPSNFLRNLLTLHQLNGESSIDPTGLVQTSLDFSTKDQIREFSSQDGLVFRTNGNSLGLEPSIQSKGAIGYAVHFARWRPPFRFDFSVEDPKQAFRIALVSGTYAAAASKINPSSTIIEIHKSKIQLNFREAVLSETVAIELNEKRYDTTIAFDGKEWIIHLNGQEVIRRSGDKHNPDRDGVRLGLEMSGSRMYSHIKMKGQLIVEDSNLPLGPR